MSAFLPRRTGTKAASRAAFVVPGCYLLAALVLTWRLWADPSSRVVAGNGNDTNLFAWYLRYSAAAVSHGRLPALVTTAMNAPHGINMMWNTSLLLPGVIMAPVTLLLGPQVSLTILTTVGFAGSAAAMFWVLRRWRVSVGAAALAGAVYGFSPALLHSAIGHYNLQLAILPPLIVDAGVRLAVGSPAALADPAAPAQAAPAQAAVAAQPARAAAAAPSSRWLSRVPAPVRAGAWLGLLVSAQLFISEELALTTALAGLLLVLGLAVARPRDAVRNIGRSAVGFIVAIVVTLALAGPALWTQFSGPLTQHGALFRRDLYVNDIAGFVTPSKYLLFHTAGTAAAAASYRGGAPEYLAYLGWPLIVVLALAAVACWRKPAGLAVALTLAVLMVLSLGAHPLLNGSVDLAVNLPWHWVQAHPLLAAVLPDRLSIVADAAAAVLLALGIDAARSRAPAPALVMAVAVLACLPLLPLPLSAAGTTAVPAGWSRAFADLRLPDGARVLVVPVPTNTMTIVMRWQAETDQPSSLVGGYFIGPGRRGKGYIEGQGVRPTAWYLDRLWAAGLPPGDADVGAARSSGLATASAAGPAAAGMPPAQSTVRADFASWRPAAVVAVTTLSSPLGRYLVRLLGEPAIQSGDVLAWRRSGKLLISNN